MSSKYAFLSCLASVLVLSGCGGSIREIDPDKNIMLELKFSDADVKRASNDFLGKVQRQLEKVKSDKDRQVILFERIENKTDEHIAGIDVIADIVLTDLLDTGEFMIVDKRERETISEELEHQKNSGLYADDTAVKSGMRIAPNYRLRGQIISDTQENRDMVLKSYFIRLSLVNMESGLVIVQSRTQVKKVEDK